jgi:hypothetical protein
MGLGAEVLEQLDKATEVVMDMVSLEVVLQEEEEVEKVLQALMATVEGEEVVALD